MLKKTITYKNPFTGESKTEDFYFNISKAEATKMAMIEGEGMDDRIRGLVAANDGKAVLEQFDKIIATAYGKRDGDNFVKSAELTEAFMSSEAYSELFLEFVTNPNSAQEFVKGMLPSEADLAELLEKVEKNTGAPVEQAKDDRPAWIRENREPTKKELDGMTKAQLVEVMQRKTS